MWIGLALAAPGYAPSDAIKLEKDAIAYRLAIQSGKVALRSRLTTTSTTEPSKTRDRQKLLFLDGQSLREDSEAESPAGAAGPANQTYWERNALTDTEHYHCTGGLSGGEGPYGAQLKSRSLIKSPLEANVTDLRNLGLVLSDSYNLKQFTPRAFLDHSNCEITAVEESEVEGEPCVLIAFRYPDGGSGTMCISPRKGPSIVSVSMKSDSLEERLKCTLSQDGRSGVWFPSRCHYEYVVNGAVTTDENLEVQVEALNQSLPGSEFSFVGMALEPNSKVVVNSSDGDVRMRLWTGTELMAEKTPNWRTPKQPPQPKYTWYWAGGVAVVIVAAGLLARNLLERRSAK